VQRDFTQASPGGYPVVSVGRELLRDEAGNEVIRQGTHQAVRILRTA